MSGMNREQTRCLRNAQAMRKSEKEARRKGDLESAQDLAKLARSYEEDADFWEQTEES